MTSFFGTRTFIPLIALLLLEIGLVGCPQDHTAPTPSPAPAPSPGTSGSSSSYPLHSNIKVTVFWVGEEADASNAGIANRASAWDSHWAEHFGGIDDPLKRNGFLPSGFKPLENPFYFALPYNDYGSKGRRSDAASTIPWAGERSWSSSESMCKNRWIKIVKGDRTAYAQWEDVGPFLSDDKGYVFGTAQPSNTQLAKAGLDLSPAVKDYLKLADVDTADWQFVDDKDLPDGPWKLTITTRQVSW